MTQRILIIGGGITGLAAAYQLQKQARALGRDPEIILVEQDTKLGGKTQTDVVDDLVIEQGPDSFLVHKPWFLQLCKELGLPTVGTNPNIRSTYIYHANRLERLPVGMQIMIPTEIGPFIKTRLITPLGKLRAAMEPFVPVRRTDGDESIGSFVGRRFGKEILENLAGPLMGGIHGGDWDAVSLKATFPQFLKMEREQGSLLLAAQRNKKAHKPKGPTGSAFQTIPTGLRTAIDALIQACDGVTFKLGVALTKLTPVGDGYCAEFSNGEQIDANAVVLAIPAYATADLVQEYLPEVAGELNAIPYHSSVVAAVVYNRAEVNHPLDASGFLVPHTEDLDVTAATWVSCKWPHSAPQDKVLMRCFLGRGFGKDWTQESDEAVTDAVRRDLKKTMGLSAEPVLSRVYRWPRAMAQYRVGHLERMDRVDSLMQQRPGLYLAGAAYRGVGLPDCVREGTQAADKIVKHLKW